MVEDSLAGLHAFLSRGQMVLHVGMWFLIWKHEITVFLRDSAWAIHGLMLSLKKITKMPAEDRG